MSDSQALPSVAGAALPWVDTIGGQKLTRHPKPVQGEAHSTGKSRASAHVRRSPAGPVKRASIGDSDTTQAPIMCVDIQKGFCPGGKLAVARPVRIAKGETVDAPSEADVELVSAMRFFGELARKPDGEKPEAGERGLSDESYATKIGSYWNQILGRFDHKTGWFIPLTIRNVTVAAASEQERVAAPRTTGRYAAFTSSGTQPATRVVINSGNAKDAKAPRAKGKPANGSPKKAHGLGLAALAGLLPDSDSHDSV